VLPPRWLIALVLIAAFAGPARADLTIRAVHFRDGGMSPDLMPRQDERISLTSMRRRTDDSTSYVYSGHDSTARVPHASAMTEVVALDKGVLWGWAPDGDGYREAPLSQVRGQRGALWRQVIGPEPGARAAIEVGADTLGPYATPLWEPASGKRTIAGLEARRVVATWYEGAEDSVVLEAWLAARAPGEAERAAFDAGARQAMLLDPLLPLGIADQWGPAWLRVTRVLRAAGGLPLAIKVSRWRSTGFALEDRFEVLEVSTAAIDPGRFEVPAGLKLLE
jgi:hypothetical protein